MNLKGLIFDMDGTITLTEQLHYRAYSEILATKGISYSFKEHMERFAGSGSEHIFKTLFNQHGKILSEEELEELIKRKRARYHDFIDTEEIPLVPGIHEFMQEAGLRNLKRIIATGNSDLSAVRKILSRVHLDQFFPDIVSITEVPRAKPFPDVFIEALKRLGVTADEAIVLEDAINGVEAAKAAHIRCIALATGTAPQELRRAGASDVVSNYHEVKKLLLSV